MTITLLLYNLKLNILTFSTNLKSSLIILMAILITSWIKNFTFSLVLFTAIRLTRINDACRRVRLYGFRVPRVVTVIALAAAIITVVMVVIIINIHIFDGPLQRVDRMLFFLVPSSIAITCAYVKYPLNYLFAVFSATV